MQHLLPKTFKDENDRLWKSFGLNECMRVIKYLPGFSCFYLSHTKKKKTPRLFCSLNCELPQKKTHKKKEQFNNRHLDGNVEIDDETCSFYTFTVYLNDVPTSHGLLFFFEFLCCFSLIFFFVSKNVEHI